MRQGQLLTLSICLLSLSWALSTTLQDDYITMAALDVHLTATGFQGVDVGMGADGDTYIVGTDGKLYFLDQATNSYSLVQGDKDIPKLGRVDVDDDGTPYVVTDCGGQVFYLDCQNNWVELPGCAKDIGVGRGGDVWKIGCDARLGGYGVWKLFCKCACKCNCNRQCTRFRPHKYASKTKEEERNCYWYRVEGAGLKIDVDIHGNPWTVADNHMVYNYDGINWKSAPGFDAHDITVSNDNVVFASAKDKKSVGRLVCDELGTWQVLAGSSKSISAGPFSLYTSIGDNHDVLTTSLRDVN